MVRRFCYRSRTCAQFLAEFDADEPAQRWLNAKAVKTKILNSMSHLRTQLKNACLAALRSSRLVERDERLLDSIKLPRGPLSLSEWRALAPSLLLEYSRDHEESEVGLARIHAMLVQVSSSETP